MEEKEYSKLYRTLGASNHVDDERADYDFYATDPKAMEMLLAKEIFNNNILEPAAGIGHLVGVLEDNGYKVTASDIVGRNYCKEENFFAIQKWNGDIITNPPYSNALEFVKHALDIIPNGHKVAMFLKVVFLEGQSRKQFFEENPFKTMYVFSKRIQCAKNGDFNSLKGSSAIAYAWFVWEKGFKGNPTVKWL